TLGATSSATTQTASNATQGTGGGANTLDTVTSTSSGPTGPCSEPEVRLTEIALPSPVIGSGNEGDTTPLPMAIAAKPSGGSTLAWLGDDGHVHIVDLGSDDQIVGTAFSLPAVNLQDIAADASGGVVVLTRDAEGGGTLNCGVPANLCDGGPDPAIPCYDMYMVRFDDGSETWATKLTTSSASLPPYSTGPEGPTVNMIWWYQHHGRIATDGTNYAAYFCNAISVSEGGCINIHEGDRMQVVGPGGDILDHPDAFGLGCSHSWNTRIVWDDATQHFVMVCATDNQNRIARPAPYRTIFSTPDIGSASVGDLVVASGGGYWVSVSHEGTLRLLHFDEDEPDQNIEITSAEFSHLVSYGTANMIIAWESGSGMTAQVRSSADGSEVSAPFDIDVPDHRYQAFKSFPDGSVAYAAHGASSQSARIARVLPCEG
ncbi:MAG TPA: hypothetical protein VFU02_11250, partial [Polyangiaceae bacterium]|nr:hypothetical protein [Polyangiaceae bacterium]